MVDLKRILYVEDDRDIQIIAKLALEKLAKFEVRICSSGLEALECAEDFEPQMIILDVMMPGMDGPATLQALKKKEKITNIPMVFVTAKVQPTEVARYLSIGAQAVLAKPFQPKALAKQLVSIWEQSQKESR